MTENLIYYSSRSLQPDHMEINIQFPPPPHTNMYMLYKQKFRKHMGREGWTESYMYMWVWLLGFGKQINIDKKGQRESSQSAKHQKLNPLGVLSRLGLVFQLSPMNEKKLMNSELYWPVKTSISNHSVYLGFATSKFSQENKNI